MCRRCIADLQAEVAMLSQERDKLALELKRTPELIQSALTDLQEKSEFIPVPFQHCCMLSCYISFRGSNWILCLKTYTYFIMECK